MNLVNGLWLCGRLSVVLGVGLRVIFSVVFAGFLFTACGEKEPSPGQNFSYEGGGGKSFKVPMPKGYDWEVSQSWGEHCEECDEKYSSTVSYCESSHMDSSCEFGWDFNLPGNADSGKPVLASGDGVVKAASSGNNGGWGNVVVIDHGNNICSRYAHLLDGSIVVGEGEDVCQGMELAKIGDTGYSFGAHLHFQFENCETQKPIGMGFTDGNGIPTCVRGNDLYDDGGNYVALQLTNSMKKNCTSATDFDGGPLGEGGWISASCGALPGCPMIPNCGRSANHHFPDEVGMSAHVKKAAKYLYGECAVDGVSSGAFDAYSSITRAQALKISMYLFGMDGGCGKNEPFTDVGQSDWFFDAVVCAVKYGIVEPDSEFNPDGDITFAQAAKFVVMAAAAADVIEVRHPSTAHFPEIEEDHWAYEYVETLYLYGGLLGDPESYSPSQKINRGEYALMVASMSPCFCENVSCENGCSCNQETFSCMDGSNDAGTGGENEDLSDLLYSTCYNDPAHMECDGTNTVLYIKCDLENGSGSDIHINDLVMNLEINVPDCEVTDPNLQSGAGTQLVEAGETKSLNGHYEISCSYVDNSYEFEVSFDLKEKISGEIVWTYDAAAAMVEFNANTFPDCGGSNVDSGSGGGDCVPYSCFDVGRNCGPFDDGCGNILNCGSCESPLVCIGGLCRPCEDAACWQNWECDPAKSYKVTACSSAGGSVEILLAGSNLPIFHPLQSDSSYCMYINLSCSSLPTWILVHGGQSGISFDVKPNSYPPAAFYDNYESAITTDPPGQPTEIATHGGVGTPFGTLLVRIPFEF